MYRSPKSASSTVSAIVLLGIIFFAPVQTGQAQNIDILLKGGHVIDAKNKMDSRMDVAITDGKILEVSPNISATNAKKVIDATGFYVAPDS